MAAKALMSTMRGSILWRLFLTECELFYHNQLLHAPHIAVEMPSRYVRFVPLGSGYGTTGLPRRVGGQQVLLNTSAPNWCE